MKETLERALAALIDFNEQSKGGIPFPAEIDDAMDALRDGIAALGAQEPVAWMNEDESTCYAGSNLGIRGYTKPLYTTPQLPQRIEWQRVPKEPTQEMAKVFHNTYLMKPFTDAYKALLSAAKEPT